MGVVAAVDADGTGPSHQNLRFLKSERQPLGTTEWFIVYLKWYECMLPDWYTLTYSDIFDTNFLHTDDVYSCRRHLTNEIWFLMFVIFYKMLRLIFECLKNAMNGFFLGKASIMSTLSLQFLVKCV